jgi:hypothetical protein
MKFACHYCARPTSQGQAHPPSFQAADESLDTTVVYPACCSREACLERWTPLRATDCSTELLAQAASASEQARRCVAVTGAYHEIVRRRAS